MTEFLAEFLCRKVRFVRSPAHRIFQLRDGKLDGARAARAQPAGVRLPRGPHRNPGRDRTPARAPGSALEFRGSEAARGLAGLPRCSARASVPLEDGSNSEIDRVFV